MFGRKKFSDNGPVDFIIVGLGNPSKQYENTRHNSGYMALDRLSQKYDCKLKKIKFKSLVGECKIENKRCLLMKPTTFMNNSGIAVKEAMNFYKIPPEKVVIIFDDISLPVGKMRIKRKGSDGGQNGMKNIIYLCNSEMFPRIKIGIGAKPHPDYDLKDWVLSKFSSSDMKVLSPLFDDVCTAAELIISDKTDEAMNKFN